MARESPFEEFLFVSEWRVTALFPALFFKEGLVFHFSIDSLQNLKILLFTLTNSIDFSTQLCGKLSNAFR